MRRPCHALRDGTAVERCPSAGVLRRRPIGTAGVVAVLQPSIRVGNVDAVENVDDVMTLRVASHRWLAGQIPQPYAITTVRTVEIALIQPSHDQPEQKNAAG